jgi:hypothetical protein
MKNSGTFIPWGPTHQPLSPCGPMSALLLPLSLAAPVPRAVMSRRYPHYFVPRRSLGARPPLTPGTTVPDPLPSAGTRRAGPHSLPHFFLCLGAKGTHAPLPRFSFVHELLTLLALAKGFPSLCQHLLATAGHRRPLPLDIIHWTAATEVIVASSPMSCRSGECRHPPPCSAPPPLHARAFGEDRTISQPPPRQR